MTVRAISFGGGVQSVAMMVLAARREIEFRTLIFANVGADSEHPDTMAYLETIALEYALVNGLDLQIVQKHRRTGEVQTVLGKIEDDTASVSIPVRMPSGAPGARNCTVDFKIKVIAKRLKQMGATKDDPAEMALGISMDEFQRMRTDSGIPHERLVYPLIERGMSRQDCINLIESEGLPVPPKSSCWFCPFHTPAHWKRMLRHEPELFAQSVKLERMMNDRRTALGKDPVWLTRFLRPLDEAITEDGQMEMFDDGATCDIGGYCHS